MMLGEVPSCHHLVSFISSPSCQVEEPGPLSHQVTQPGAALPQNFLSHEMSIPEPLGDGMSATGSPSFQTVESRALPIVTALLSPTSSPGCPSIPPFSLHDCLCQLGAPCLASGL